MRSEDNHNPGDEIEVTTPFCDQSTYQLFVETSRKRIIDLCFEDLLFLTGHDDCCGLRMRAGQA